jgi:threonine dehydratase
MSTPLKPSDLAYPAVTADELQSAAARIEPFVVRTPVVPFDGAVARDGGATEILLKLDMLQSVGSFKIRSAANILQLLKEGNPELLKRGVCTASSGNWAQAVAFMCRSVGCAFTVIVPETCPKAKTDNISRIYPAAKTVKLTGDEFWEVVTTLHYAGAPDAVFVSSVIDRETIAGNGTIALELFEQVEDFSTVDAVLVPTGGGALALGVAAAIHHAGLQTKTWAVEVDTAAPFAAAFAAGADTGELGALFRPTFVDCIGNKAIFPGIWRSAEASLAGSLVVSPADCAAAVKLILEKNKVLAEGGSAAPLAAALKYGQQHGWKRVVCLISGGQIDVLKVGAIINGDVPGEPGLKLAKL